MRAPNMLLADLLNSLFLRAVEFWDLSCFFNCKASSSTGCTTDRLWKCILLLVIRLSTALRGHVYYGFEKGGAEARAVSFLLAKDAVLLAVGLLCARSAGSDGSGRLYPL